MSATLDASELKSISQTGPAALGRVLLCGINYAPEPTGVGRYSGQLGAYLHDTGCDLNVVTAVPHYPGWQAKPPFKASRYYVETGERLRITRCPLLLRKEMRGIWRLIAPLSFAASSAPIALWELVRRRPDTLLCVEPTLFSSVLPVLLARLMGVRTVLHVQDLEVDAALAVGHLSSGSLLQRLAFGFERFVLRRFDAVVTISEKMRSLLAAKGVDDDRLAVVRNWVDLDKIRPMTGENVYRRELGIKPDTFVALYSGNIGAKQALPVILDAAERLKDNDRILFVIAGEGPEKSSLEKRYGHLPNVRFLPLQPEERLCAFFNLADVHLLPQLAGIADLVLPSKLGGMLASGKPSLVCANEGTELFDFLDGTAILVPAGDTGALASELLVLAEQGTHPMLGDGRALARQLSSDTVLRSFAALLFGIKATS